MPSTGGGLRKSGNLLWKEESDPEEDLDQDLQTGPAVLGQSAMGRTRKVPGGCVPSLVQRFNFGPLSHAQALVSEEVAVLEHRLGKTSSPGWTKVTMGGSTEQAPGRAMGRHSRQALGRWPERVG